MLRTIVRNVFASWIGAAAQVVVTFFLTPFVLHALGGARYGAWSLLIGLTGYYGLVDLGFRAGLTQYLARYLATEDFEKLNKTASTGFVALVLVGFGLALVTLLLTFVAHRVFQFPDEAIREIRWAILIVGLGVAFQFPFFVFSAALTATQRYEVSNAIAITTRLIGAGITIILLKSGYGLTGISLATLVAQFVDYVLRWRAAHHFLPQLTISPWSANWASCREFMQFGVWNVLITGSRRIIDFSGALIIGLFLPTAAIAPYALATSLVNYFDKIVTPAAQVFFPLATQLDASGDIQRLQKLYLAGSRILFCLAISLGLIGAVWSDDFFRLWVGEEYLGGNEYASVSRLFRILICAAVFEAGRRIGQQIFLGCRLLKTLSFLFMTECVLSLMFSVLFVRPLRVVGVAIGALVPVILVRLVADPIFLSRFLGLRLTGVISQIYGRPLALAGFLLPALLSMRYFCGAPESWIQLFYHGFFALTVATLSIVAIGVSNSERQRFLPKPIQPFFSYFVSRGRSLYKKLNGGCEVGNDCSQSVPISRD